MATRKKKSTLSEQISSAQAEVSTWTPERKAAAGIREETPEIERAIKFDKLPEGVTKAIKDIQADGERFAKTMRQQYTRQIVDVIRDLIWVATERDKKNRVREFDAAIEAGQRVLIAHGSTPTDTVVGKPGIWCGRAEIFEGVVHSVNGEVSFNAKLTSLSSELEPHFATFEFARLDPADHALVKPGAVFHVTLEEYTGRATITMRRKVWKAEDVQAIKESAAELAATFQDTDTDPLGARTDTDAAILEGLKRKKPRHKDQVQKVANHQDQIRDLARVLVDATAEIEGQMGQVAAELSSASSLFATWWAMTEADHELMEERLPDDTLVVQFMGSGASCQVFAKDIRRMLAAIQKAIDCEVGLNMPFTWKERFEHLANLTIYCDYGDNESPGMQIGWGIMQRSKDDPPRIGYGPSVTKAIDASIVEWRQRRTGTGT